MRSMRHLQHQGRSRFPFLSLHRWISWPQQPEDLSSGDAPLSPVQMLQAFRLGCGTSQAPSAGIVLL